MCLVWFTPCPQKPPVLIQGAFRKWLDHGMWEPTGSQSTAVATAKGAAGSQSLVEEESQGLGPCRLPLCPPPPSLSFLPPHPKQLSTGLPSPMLPCHGAVVSGLKPLQTASQHKLNSFTMWVRTLSLSDKKITKKSLRRNPSLKWHICRC